MVHAETYKVQKCIHFSVLHRKSKLDYRSAFFPIGYIIFNKKQKKVLNIKMKKRKQKY